MFSECRQEVLRISRSVPASSAPRAAPKFQQQKPSRDPCQLHLLVTVSPTAPASLSDPQSDSRRSAISRESRQRCQPADCARGTQLLLESLSSRRGASMCTDTARCVRGTDGARSPPLGLTCCAAAWPMRSRQAELEVDNSDRVFTSESTRSRTLCRPSPLARAPPRTIRCCARRDVESDVRSLEHGWSGHRRRLARSALQATEMLTLPPAPLVSCGSSVSASSSACLAPLSRFSPGCA
jgi:hypothetical protein